MKINLNDNQLNYLMNEFQIHHVQKSEGDFNGHLMTLQQLRGKGSVLLLTHFSAETGLDWNKGENIRAVVVWADWLTENELESRAEQP